MKADPQYNVVIRFNEAGTKVHGRPSRNIKAIGTQMSSIFQLVKDCRGKDELFRNDHIDYVSIAPVETPDYVQDLVELSK